MPHHRPGIDQSKRTMQLGEPREPSLDSLQRREASEPPGHALELTGILSALELEYIVLFYFGCVFGIFH